MGIANQPEVDLAARVAKLTAGQRECLELVDDHATSKEIARELGISRHTVDARLRGAIQTLGVASRREAAVIYRAANQADSYHSFAYQPSQIVPPPVSPPNPLHGSAGDQEHGHQPFPFFPSGRAAEAGDCPPDSAGQNSLGRESLGPESLGHAGAGIGGLDPAALASLAGHASRADHAPLADHVADGAAWALPRIPGARASRSAFRLWGGANDLTPPQRILAVFVVSILAMMAFGMLLSGIEALTLLRS